MPRESPSADPGSGSRSASGGCAAAASRAATGRLGGSRACAAVCGLAGYSPSSGPHARAFGIEARALRHPGGTALAEQLHLEGGAVLEILRLHIAEGEAL